MKGVLENIQHYCIHDGPGIRTVVFLKGCPLRCRWCSNPTTQEHKPELLYHADKCFSCGHCAEICPQRAVTREGEAVIFDRALCDGCGLCAKECPGKALQIAGVERDTADVLEDIKKDMAFYRNSGGGVTLSGGEVLAQAAFALDLMELTGQGCGLILDNLDAVLDRAAGKLTVRLPLIPGLNDDEGHLENFARTIKALGRVQAVELLPYHRLGKNKYALLGQAYALESLGPMSKEDLARRAAFVAERLGGTKVLF